MDSRLLRDRSRIAMRIRSLCAGVRLEKIDLIMHKQSVQYLAFFKYVYVDHHSLNKVLCELPPMYRQ